MECFSEGPGQYAPTIIIKGGFLGEPEVSSTYSPLNEYSNTACWQTGVGNVTRNSQDAKPFIYCWFLLAQSSLVRRGYLSSDSEWLYLHYFEGLMAQVHFQVGVPTAGTSSSLEWSTPGFNRAYRCAGSHSSIFSNTSNNYRYIALVN